MRETDLSELQNLTVDEIAEQVGGLTADQLAELRALETEAGAVDGRKGVLAAIDAAAEVLSNAPPADPAPADKKKGGKAGKAAAATPTIADSGEKTDADAWQAPDYNGPITIPQANWRRENIKPVREVVTK